MMMRRRLESAAETLLDPNHLWDLARSEASPQLTPAGGDDFDGASSRPRFARRSNAACLRSVAQLLVDFRHCVSDVRHLLAAVAEVLWQTDHKLPSAAVDGKRVGHARR